MNVPSKTRWAAGIALLAQLACVHAVETTAQNWRELGAGSATDNGISNETSGVSASPAAMVNPANGNVFVAWESGNSEIYLRKWTGTEWAQLGGSGTASGISNTPGASKLPSVALTGEGVPVVAWLDDSSGKWEVYLKKFNPTTNTWVGVGGSAEGGGLSKAAGGIENPAGAAPTVAAGAAAGVTGQLYVSWAKNSATEKHVYVSTPAATGWTTLGGSVDSVEYSDGPTAGIPATYLGASDPSLAIGVDNAPTVAYLTKSSTSNGDVHIRRWNGIAWIPAGTGAATNGGISGVQLSADYQLSRPRLAYAPNGPLHAAWLYADASQKLGFVKRLEGGAWAPAGPALATTLAIFESGVSLGFAQEGSPLLSWVCDLPVMSITGNSEIYVSKLTRTNTTNAPTWQEFGTGSASGGGVSSTAINSRQPAFANARGPVAPVLVWADDTDLSDPRATQIFARRAQLPESVFEFGSTTYNTKEGMPPATIQVVRRGNPSGEGKIHYATEDGTATAGADYTATSGELTFAPGETVKTFTVPIATDTLVEPSENVRLVLSNPGPGSGLGAVSTANLVIADSPPPTSNITLHFRNTGLVIGEGGARVIVEVVREGDSSIAVSVGYETPPSVLAIVGLAMPGLDFTAVSGTLNFEAGVTSRSIEIPILEDTLVEGRETFTARLFNPTGGATLVAPSTCTIAIEDNDQPTTTAGRLQFKLANQGVSEGAGKVEVQVDRVGGSAGQVTVNYATTMSPGTNAATPDVDYTSASGTLTFGDGETSKTFNVAILEDTTVEVGELINVKLSSPTGGATLGNPAVAGILITDNDIPPPPTSTVQFNPGEYSVTEAGGLATLRVTRVGDTSTPASVEYITPEVAITLVGVATPGADFEITSGTLNFAAGEKEKSFTVAIKADDLIEPNEVFEVRLKNAVGTALGTPAVARVVIVAQSLPQPGVLGFASSEFRVGENAGQAKITVTRRLGSAGEVSVKYATSAPAEHAATPDVDYTPAAGTITFANGEVSKTFAVPILQDTDVEGPESVLLTLSDPVGTTLADGAAKAMLVIADDDQPAGRLRFITDGARVREGAGFVTLIVGRFEGSAGEVTVKYATADGTATMGSDYTGTAGVLTFAAGQLSKAITVPILKDSRNEGAETFTVSLSDPTGGATLGTPSTVTVTIVDAEAAGVIQFYRNDYTANERSEGALITVLRTEGAAGEVTVDYATQDGTAEAGSDYTATTGTLTFAAGQKVARFRVPLLNDTTPEATEALNLLLSNPTGGAVLGTRNLAQLTIADNDQASRVQFAAADYRVREDNLAGFAQILVVRRGSVAGTTTVHCATADGTATAGADYTETSGVLEFRPGQYSKTFRVPVLRDDALEGLESVKLTLSEVDGGILGTPSEAVLTIGDPELRNGSIQFASAQFKVNEAAGVATITVTRFGLLGSVTVKYAATAGTATDTDDFIPVSGVLQFAAGETKKTFTVPITKDNVTEEPETILLSLSDPTGGALLGTPSQAVLTIYDATATAGVAAQ